MALDVFFQGIASPARIIGADGLIDLLPDLAFGWPFRVAKADAAIDPFYSIEAEAGRDRLTCRNLINPGPARSLDQLNALCDLFAALASVLPTNDPEIITLHAAAVRVSGQLLIFPNVRRAGKSTLSVALAAAGHGLVGDDVVPLAFDGEGRPWAQALGLLPRLRLPLPETASPRLRTWVDGAKGVRNRQYHYVRVPEQPLRGAAFPVAGFVILDRTAEPVPARIEPISADRAMDALLYQNFSRDRHSGDVLARVAGMLVRCPAFQLSYFDLDSAVRCLEDAFHGRAAPAMTEGPQGLRPFRLADFGVLTAPAVLPGVGLVQRPGTEAQRIGETLYLADAGGKAIHRMDPLATAIWDLLAEPASPDELAMLLAEAFPDADRRQIAADLGKLLTQWAKAGLIEVSPVG